MLVRKKVKENLLNKRYKEEKSIYFIKKKIIKSFK